MGRDGDEEDCADANSNGGNDLDGPNRDISPGAALDVGDIDLEEDDVREASGDKESEVGDDEAGGCGESNSLPGGAREDAREVRLRRRRADHGVRPGHVMAREDHGRGDLAEEAAGNRGYNGENEVREEVEGRAVDDGAAEAPPARSETSLSGQVAHSCDDAPSDRLDADDFDDGLFGVEQVFLLSLALRERRVGFIVFGGSLNRDSGSGSLDHSK